MRNKSGIILDLDGVVYEGSDVLPGVLEAIASLQRRGKRVAYLTNNSAKSADQIFEKLSGLGIACERQEVITASETAASFIARQQLDGGRGVLVIGTNELKQALVQAGVGLSDAASCGAVLVGFHPGFSFPMLCDGLDALQRGVPLIACNRDANYPGQGGRLLPGCGAIVAALEAAAQRQTDHDVGKPNTLMFDQLVARLGLAPEHCVVVGDGLQSDIRMANAASVASVWISRGRALPSGVGMPAPDLVATDLGVLAALLLA